MDHGRAPAERLLSLDVPGAPGARPGDHAAGDRVRCMALEAFAPPPQPARGADGERDVRGGHRDAPHRVGADAGGHGRRGGGTAPAGGTFACLLVACGRAARHRVGLRAAPPGRPAHPLEHGVCGGGGVAGAGGGIRRMASMGRCAAAARAEGRCRVLRAEPGAHCQRRLHPGTVASPERRMHGVPPGCVFLVGTQRPCGQQLQQPDVRLQRARDPAPCLRARGQGERRALLRRVPRSRAVLHGCLRECPLRRSAVRRLEGSAGFGQHHLHGLPLDHRRPLHARERRLRDRGERAVSLRRHRQPVPFLGEPPAHQGEACVPQADLSEAGGASQRRVLLHLPQGVPPRGSQRLQVAARPEPLRLLAALQSQRHRRAGLVLAQGARHQLQRLPHAGDGKRRPGRKAARARRRAAAARPPVRGRKYRHGRAQRAA